MSIPAATSWERRLLSALFVVALVYNVCGVGYHFTVGFMSGHEFRQSQTAITSYYIDKENNFSLLYETPIVGKPWVSILMEVPLYEWSVVGLSRATGWPHVVAARAVSATCFYLTLPALYLLLGRLGLSRPRRLLVLALVLSAPAYIYYTRAFLMDAMALMGSAWFLLGFVRTMEERRWGWLALTVVAGTLAALVKSVIFSIWMLPAAAYGAWLLWRDLRARTGWRAPVRTLLWGLGTVVVALGLLRWWVAYTDPIKAAHASAWIFTSKNLSEGNWGLFNPKPLFSAELWGQLMACWEQAMMSRWLIGGGVLLGLALPRVRWWVLGATSVFFLAQALMPFAFAYQDYYFYSCAAFVEVALGLMVVGLLDTRARWAGVLVAVGLMGAQVHTYWQGYRTGQAIDYQGGYPFTDVLRELTPKNTVIVVAGADWAAMTPLYAQRRALMIRNGLEYDQAYLKRAFDDLAGEEVSALVLYRETRGNRNLINLVASRFDMDPSVPTYSYQQLVDVYVARPLARGVQLRIRDKHRYPDIRIPPGSIPDEPLKGLVKITPAMAAIAFPDIKPGPYQIESQFGLDWIDRGSSIVMSAHPNSDMWLTPPAKARHIEWSFGIFEGAYAKPEVKTDGVEFIIQAETPDGKSREIFRRLLDPAQRPADRPDQHIDVPYTPRPGENLHFSTRPHRNSVNDWAYIIAIKVN